MSNQQYVTITHYKEREFYFLNHAIQTNDGFIAKEIEQFHESDKEKLIERIHGLQAQYPTHNVISLSLEANQVVKDSEDPLKASAKIFKDNYVIQEKIDIGNVPVNLYFSPFTILYEEYKHKLDDKLTLMIGLFNRKLYIMFANRDKIQQSWTIGTRGLTEKQIADRVYKTMKAYYKISFKFADHIEMLVPQESPKLLKVLRTELDMNILPTQKTIHFLLHSMGSDQRKFGSSYVKSPPRGNVLEESEENSTHNLTDIKLNTQEPTTSFSNKIKASFQANDSMPNVAPTEKMNFPSFSFISFIPLAFVLAAGAYFTMQNQSLENKLNLLQTQSYAQTNHALLAMNAKEIFNAMGKSAELNSAIISKESIELKGIVWGIEPLRNKLNDLYQGGNFTIKPLENFMTEFSFKSKI